MRKTIELEWPILPGSISTARSRCGKARCACKLKPHRLHGIYYRWTGFIEGRRTTKTVSKEVAQECIRRIRNYRRLQRGIEKLLRKALANAPWTSRSTLPQRKSKRS
ncbi:MAG: DUF6788 family protein [Terriglobia bacterium]|jgi:hypothetical protein